MIGIDEQSSWKGRRSACRGDGGRLHRAVANSAEGVEVHMSKSIGRFVRQTLVLVTSYSLYAGPAPAHANAPGASLTGNNAPKQEERAPDPAPALSIGHGARDRLADFFERTRGGTRVIAASEVWQ